MKKIQREQEQKIKELEYALKMSDDTIRLHDKGYEKHLAENVERIRGYIMQIKLEQERAEKMEAEKDKEIKRLEELLGQAKIIIDKNDELEIDIAKLKSEKAELEKENEEWEKFPREFLKDMKKDFTDENGDFQKGLKEKLRPCFEKAIKQAIQSERERLIKAVKIYHGYHYIKTMTVLELIKGGKV